MRRALAKGAHASIQRTERQNSGNKEEEIDTDTAGSGNPASEEEPVRNQDQEQGHASPLVERYGTF